MELTIEGVVNLRYNEIFIGDTNPVETVFDRFIGSRDGCDDVTLFLDGELFQGELDVWPTLVGDTDFCEVDPAEFYIHSEDGVSHNILSKLEALEGRNVSILILGNY